MGEIRVVTKSYKGWEAKLQRVWNKKDKTGYITIVEEMFAHENRYEIMREGKPYAFDRTYDDLDMAIRMAESSMLEAEAKYINSDGPPPESRPLHEEEMRSAGILEDAKNEGKREVLSEFREMVEKDMAAADAAAEAEMDAFNEDIQTRFTKIERDIKVFEKSLEQEQEQGAPK